MVHSVMLQLGIMGKSKSSTNFYNTQGCVNAFYCTSCTVYFISISMLAFRSTCYSLLQSCSK